MEPKPIIIKYFYHSDFLIDLLAFEKQWLKYYFLEGLDSFYREELKKQSKKLFKRLNEIDQEDNSILTNLQFKLTEPMVRAIIDDFINWADDDELFPKFFTYFNSIEQGQLILNCFFTNIEYNIISKSGSKIEEWPLLSLDTSDVQLHGNQIKWRQHVDYRVIRNINDDFLNNISNENSIVIVADIRNSQDMITYSPNPQIYIENVMRLVNEARKIVTQNFGIFDRFTGDGFICYFNKYISNHIKQADEDNKDEQDYLKTALCVCNEILKLSGEIFKEWEKCVRKLPYDDVGLSIGIDSGKISFLEVDSHFFAIGEPCVWATRACDVGNAGDIVLNNIVYHECSQIFSDLKTKESPSLTKRGESFRVHIIDKEWRNNNLELPQQPMTYIEYIRRFNG